MLQAACRISARQWKPYTRHLISAAQVQGRVVTKKGQLIQISGMQSVHLGNVVSINDVSGQLFFFDFLTDIF